MTADVNKFHLPIRCGYFPAIGQRSHNCAKVLKQRCPIRKRNWNTKFLFCLPAIPTQLRRRSLQLESNFSSRTIYKILVHMHRSDSYMITCSNEYMSPNTCFQGEWGVTRIRNSTHQGMIAGPIIGGHGQWHHFHIVEGVVEDGSYSQYVGHAVTQEGEEIPYPPFHVHHLHWYHGHNQHWWATHGDFYPHYTRNLPEDFCFKLKEDGRGQYVSGIINDVRTSGPRIVFWIEVLLKLEPNTCKAANMLSINAVPHQRPFLHSYGTFSTPVDRWSIAFFTGVMPYDARLLPGTWFHRHSAYSRALLLATSPADIGFSCESLSMGPMYESVAIAADVNQTYRQLLSTGKVVCKYDGFSLSILSSPYARSASLDCDNWLFRKSEPYLIFGFYAPGRTRLQHLYFYMFVDAQGNQSDDQEMFVNTMGSCGEPILEAGTMTSSGMSKNDYPRDEYLSAVPLWQGLIVLSVLWWPTITRQHLL